MASPDEEITDLEAFHYELQSSLGLVKQMVTSWMPLDERKKLEAASGSSSLGLAEDAIPRGRPERLGLGATQPRPYAANATADTAEIKKLKSMLTGAKKRRKSEEPDFVPSHTASSVGTQASTSAAQIEDAGEDEEDSRSKAISGKRAKTSTSVFHDKQNGANGLSIQAPGKNKKRKKQDSYSTLPETFAAPALPKPRVDVETVRQTSPSRVTTAPTAPQSPAKSIAQVKPPYALPAALQAAGKQNAQDDEQQDEDDGQESVTTEATDSTLVATPVGSPGPEKAKKKRKKKKKKKGTPAEERIGNVVVNSSDRLFGDSVVE